MTLLEIERLSKEVLSPAEIASCLGIDPQRFRVQVWEDQRKHKNSYGFPVIISNRRIKVPKAAFLKYMRGDK